MTGQCGNVVVMNPRTIFFATCASTIAIACTSSSGVSSDAAVDAGVAADVGTQGDGASDSDGSTLKAGVHKIVFAADFDTNGGCKDHGTNDQCDLYTAELTLGDGSVSNIKRATSTTVSESYPAWNPNGKVVYYTIFKDVRTKDLGYVDLNTGNASTLIANGSWAAVSPDGSTLLYNEGKSSLLMSAPLTGGGLTLGTATALTGVPAQEDPDYSTDGRYVVLHEITKDTGAVGQVFDTQTKKVTSWGEESGHCGFGIDSLNTLCDNSKGGGVQSKLFKDGSLGPTSLFLADLKASVISAYDSELAPCQGVSFNYPTFCGDDKHLLVSTSCNQNGAVTFSRLFLADLSGASPVYRPLGKTLAEAYKGAGKSSWTVSCLR